MKDVYLSFAHLLIQQVSVTCLVQIRYCLGSWGTLVDKRKKIFFALVKLTSWGVPAQSLQSCSTLCDPMDHSLPGSSVHGILQARILAWVAVPSSRGSSQPSEIEPRSSTLQVDSLPTVVMHSYTFLFLIMSTFKIYSFINFQICNLQYC